MADRKNRSSTFNWWLIFWAGNKNRWHSGQQPSTSFNSCIVRALGQRRGELLQ
ncbi:hypothetical protein [Psychrobacter celer]|uniref:hypothetical protein n=1 Tax=Psychrobacter celer TaxID=306572 RepID=UPI002FE4815B